MAVRIEKSGPVWTVIHSRPEARNAIDPPSADAMRIRRQTSLCCGAKAAPSAPDGISNTSRACKL